MSEITYKRRGPQKNGIALKLMTFFAVNPTEELTYDDCELKFGAKRHAIQTAVGRLQSANLVEAVLVVRLPARAR